MPRSWNSDRSRSGTCRLRCVSRLAQAKKHAILESFPSFFLPSLVFIAGALEQRAQLFFIPDRLFLQLLCRTLGEKAGPIAEEVRCLDLGACGPTDLGKRCQKRCQDPLILTPFTLHRSICMLEQPRREIVQGITPGLPFVGKSRSVAEHDVFDAGFLQCIVHA